MFGKGVYQEEEVLLRDIIRSIDKKLDYSVKEGAGSHFNVTLKLRGHQGDVSLDIEDLKAAKSDMIRRHQFRQKIKHCRDHIDRSRYDDDVLGIKPAKILRSAPKPEPMPSRGGFGRNMRKS